ncbi:MAG: integrase family protein [Methylobacterium sp.]|nr:integrase family protein [Cupriavidus sp.]MCA3511985.1 integrase family protein [Rhodobacter sp.]MCA3654657.1 integrase family protein [Methylobacterium sp.]MCA3672015.1 integrase family protein [Methylobacterium sp.]MCA3676830.1 integrase family protein [Methylobacterium sp.]
MSTKLTQATVNRLAEEHPTGTQLYDADLSGLRIIVGSKSSSYKLVGRINDGSDRYVSIIIGRTDEVSLKTARDKAAELKLALRRGEDPRAPKRAVPSLRMAWDRYKKTRGAELRPSTVESYTQKVELYLKPILDVPMDKLDRETVRALHERITRNNGPYCANSAMRVLKLLHNDAARTQDLPPNPVSRAVRMNKETPRKWALDAAGLAETWRRLDAMEDRVRAACWTVMLLTGLRSHDARSMRWEHLDEDGVLTVPSPKGGADRAFRLPLPRRLLQVLEMVKQETAPMESPFVFPSLTSESGHIEEMRRTAEFPHAPHQMRHTYRTWALEAGIDMQTVTLLMNHRPAGVTWGYVTRAHLLGHMREAQEKVCQAMVRHRA